MEQTKRHREGNRGVPVGRIAAAAFAVGGLSASVFVVGIAGAATSHTTRSVVVSTARYTKLGTILVSGRTLYTLLPNKTACAAACRKIWPELVLPKGVTKATAGKGVSASKLGSVMRSNGVRQVTYNGKALYWFSGDNAAGQVHGNLTDTWGRWSDYVTVKPTTSGGGTTTTTTAASGGAAF
jgi:predicted lipoprotein with Yx(FWY)xxD motif